MNRKILFVDDEPNVLSGYERQFRKDYEITVSNSGKTALELIDSRGPFAVIVSDMRMPEMNGCQFLTEARRKAPTTTRMLLTGYAELHDAIETVNNGAIFRFLTKPCSRETLMTAIESGIEQYRLIHAERDLLENTLRACVQVLGDVIGMTHPGAFGHALRMQKLIRDLGQARGKPFGWEVSVAVVLSQLGLLAVSDEIIAKVDRGKPLTDDEQRQIDQAPQVAAKLLGRIPRLENVIEIILGSQHPESESKDPAVSEAASVLRLSNQYDQLLTRGLPAHQAFDQIRSKAHLYPQHLLSSLERLIHKSNTPESRTVRIDELTPDMILEKDLFANDGRFLLRQGNTITAALRVRLELLVAAGQISPLIRVLVPQQDAQHKI